MQNEQQQQLQNAETIRNKNFSFEDLETSWQKYLQQVDQEHVRKMLEDVEIQHTENDAVFDIFVNSKVQSDILGNEKEKIIAHLRNDLLNDSVDFHINIKRKEQIVKKTVTSKDKFEEMLNENPDFRQLAESLSLEPQ